jgi:glycosyltransferase 2 family protein
MRRRLVLPLAIAFATAAGLAVMAARVGHGAVSAATSPDWTILVAAFAVGVAVQPLRALAWRTTLRDDGVAFREIYAASAIGSFLDTVLPGRLGEASKVGVLRVASGKRWPGLPRAGGSLLCAHLLEGIAFALVGAASAFFLPLPGWVRLALLGALGLAGGGLALAALLHGKLGRFLPRSLDRFLAGAAAPPSVLARSAGILVLTWAARWGGILLMLHAFGVRASAGAALVYMLVTGLANTAPLLPGNAGVYQGAAVGALALVGHVGSKAVAVSMAAPVVASIGTAIAAALGIALFGRRFAELPRAALARS